MQPNDNMNAEFSAEKIMADLSHKLRSGSDVEEVKLKYTLIEEEIAKEV